MLVLKGLVGLHRTIQLQLLQHYWSGIDWDYCDIERFALETSRDHFVIFEIASKYYISDTFVHKVVSLHLNTLSRYVITFLPRSMRLLISWQQSLSVVILYPKKVKSGTVFIVSPSICYEVMGPVAMILVL